MRRISDGNMYIENNVDPVLGDQFLSEAYYRADEDYQGRTTMRLRMLIGFKIMGKA